MVSHEPYYVSRQSNYYSEGAYSVEIARTFEHAGPGMLVGKPTYDRFTGSYSDPRDAAKAALELAKVWSALLPGFPHVPITMAMNHMVYPTVEDDHTDDITEWAEVQYSLLPKCEQCGSMGAVEYTAYDTGLVVLACTDYHAELLLAPDNYDEGDE